MSRRRAGTAPPPSTPISWPRPVSTPLQCGAPAVRSTWSLATRDDRPEQQARTRAGRGLSPAGREYEPGSQLPTVGEFAESFSVGFGTPHHRSLSATRATVPASHYHLERTRPWAHMATVGAAVPRMAEFREIKLRPLDANSIHRGLQSSTRGGRFPVPGSAPAATRHDLSERLAITGRGHQR